MPSLRNTTYSLLRRSETLFNVDLVYLARGSFWITAGQIVSSLLSLLLILAFANLLPKETYGLYRYILSLVGVLGVFSLTGMNSAVARATAAGNEGALRASVGYQLKWNLIMLAAFFVVSGYYFINGNEAFALSFLILGLCVPTTLALNTYGAYLEGKREFRIASLSSIASSIVYVSGALAAIYFSGEFVWLIAAYALTTLGSTTFFYFYTLNKFHPPQQKSLETLSYGRKLTFIGFTAPIAAQVDKIILAHFWGPAILASYTLAQAIPDRVTSLIKDWVGIGLPKFTNKTPAEINTVFYKRILQGMGIGVVATTGYIMLAPFLFTYLLPQYLEAVRYSQILALTFLFAVPNRYVSLLLVSQQFARPIFFNSVAQNVTKTLVYVILGLTGGVLGLISANVVNAALGMVINIVFWRRATRG